ncbi:IQ motif, EF-hand binding site [Dillenia turbinata]|uniref:IQ motif, EF-hand binding site n=1 Tax=Dillenia turbinata TaxID=194707 RepID=A0AAN8UZT2_9MAGN
MGISRKLVRTVFSKSEPVNSHQSNVSHLQAYRFCTKNRGDSLQEPTKLSKEDAAIVIQAAFRGFLVRRRSRSIKTMDNEKSLAGIESPSKVSVGTSVEVLTGNSVEASPTPKESVATQHRMQHKAKT